MALTTVVVPIYNGFTDLVGCLSSLLSSREANRHRFAILLIDDASTDPRVAAYLDKLRACRLEGLRMLSNRDNLGFVGTVNRGMSATFGDVVLLNSDTIVHGDWLDRLQAAAEDRVATVTPMSNNATLASYPIINAENQIDTAEVGRLDRAFARLHRGRRVKVPTGVGFCLYIAREAIDAVGLFDVAAFGRGYGEENDFCLRAEAAGFRNVVACDAFVAHIGGSSFGAEKEALVENAQRTLAERYPRYAQSIEDFFALDPLRPFRVVSWFDEIVHHDGLRILTIAHNQGGGTWKYVADLATAGLGTVRYVALCPDEGERVRVFDPLAQCNYLTVDLAEQPGWLESFVASMGFDRIHVNHTLGMGRAIGRFLLATERPWDFTLHDYYLINANPSLTDEDGEFCEDPTSRDEGCASAMPVPAESVAAWREAQASLIGCADRVFYPVAAVRELVEPYFEANYVRAAHPDPLLDERATPVSRRGGRGRLRVGVIGALSVHKGADILESVAQLAAERALDIEFVLIGFGYRPLDNVVLSTGRFDEADLPDLLDRLEPDLIWFPARWPETYSYTLSAVIAGGWPAIVPDIGAFPERVAERPMTSVIPWACEPDDVLAAIDELVAILDRPGVVHAWERRERGALPFDGQSHAVDRRVPTADELWALVEEKQPVEIQLARSLARDLVTRLPKVKQAIPPQVQDRVLAWLRMNRK